MALSHLSDRQKNALLMLARESINRCVSGQQHVHVNVADYLKPLNALGACFVTLKINTQLRGCIGHLQAVQTLVEDVVENACSAATQDPRFPPLNASELDLIHIHISVLTPKVALPVSNEQDLLNKLQPGVDGLILKYGQQQATFLPAVWSELSQPRQFLNQLKHKAGLKPDFWSDDMRFFIYQSIAFGES